MKSQTQPRKLFTRLIGGFLIVLILAGLLFWAGSSLFGTPDTPEPFPAYPGSTQLEVIQPQLYSTCIDGLFGGRILKAYAISKIETPVLDFYREVARSRGLSEVSGQYAVQNPPALTGDTTKRFPQTCFKGDHRWHLEAANIVATIDLKNPDQLAFATRYLKEMPQNTVTVVFLTEGIISNI